MNYDLEFILNSYLSKDEVKDLSGKLSLPVSQDKSGLVNAICLRGSSAIGIEKEVFNNQMRSFLDSTWDEYYVETIRSNLNIPDSKTKTEILDEILSNLII